MIDEVGLSVDIEVDGGIKLDNVKDVIQAGANVIAVSYTHLDVYKRQ